MIDLTGRNNWWSGEKGKVKVSVWGRETAFGKVSPSVVNKDNQHETHAEGWTSKHKHTGTTAEVCFYEERFQKSLRTNLSLIYY